MRKRHSERAQGLLVAAVVAACILAPCGASANTGVTSWLDGFSQWLSGLLTMGESGTTLVGESGTTLVGESGTTLVGESGTTYNVGESGTTSY